MEGKEYRGMGRVVALGLSVLPVGEEPLRMYLIGMDDMGAEEGCHAEGGE